MKCRNLSWLALSLVLILTIPTLAIAQVLTVHFLDVGQADAILIQAPSGQNILIDAGNNADASTVVGYLKEHGIRRLDHVIGTHPHEDHVGGLDVVIGTFDIGAVYLPRVIHTTKTYEDALLAIKDKGLKVTEAKAGVVFHAGPDTEVFFLAPNSTNYEDLNNYSAVLKLTFGETSFLFTGDAEAESEMETLSLGHDVKSDVLKVAHHGSYSSTTLAFLEAVDPSYAVISVGSGNTYGHPSWDTLSRLSSQEVNVYRTDRDGSVVATSDGKKISFFAEDTSTSSPRIVIAKLDLIEEVVTIRNDGPGPADLSGWRLLSIEGEQWLTFPQGIVLEANQSIDVVSGRGATSGPGRLKWTGSYIWNNSGDSACIYSTDSTEVACSWE